ncbi:MAG: undecaprenyl diphosphate synthase family protein, partial [Ruthenibacterium sp.]
MPQQTDFAKGLSLGIIMDGNGRWAKKRGLPRTAGHTKGAEVFKDIIRYCNELQIACVTFYAFSTENWSRPLEEVNGIMKLFGEYLLMAYDYQKENNRVNFMG